MCGIAMQPSFPIIKKIIKDNMRRPGLEPGTPAWKADMLTPTPTTHNIKYKFFFVI